MGWIPEGSFNIYHTFLISASAVLTASIASLVLGNVFSLISMYNLSTFPYFECVAGVIMVFVIIISHKFHINPDNVATPIAASLGDLITLGLLSAIATLLFKAIGLLVLNMVMIIVLKIALLLISFRTREWYVVDFASYPHGLRGLITLVSLGGK